MSETYQKVVCSLEVTGTDCDRPHMGMRLMSEMKNAELMEENVTCQSPYSQLISLWTIVHSTIWVEKTAISEILSHILYLSS